MIEQPAPALDRYASVAEHAWDYERHPSRVTEMTDEARERQRAGWQQFKGRYAKQKLVVQVAE